MNQSPRVFVSHSSASIMEADGFRRLANRHRGKPAPQIFLSGDSASIPSGALWLNSIMSALNSCTHFAALIVKKEDFQNPWILFEIAFAMGRGLKPKVFVFGQLSPGAMPMPLGAVHLIDTGNTDRWRSDLVDIGLGDPEKFHEDFAHLFRQCHHYRQQPFPVGFCDGVRL